MVQPTNQSFILDASVMDLQDTHEIIRDDVKQNRVEFLFPSGVNKVDLFEEARALTKLDDFDTMFDLTMSMLHGKPVTILIKNYDGSKSELCSFQITDRYMDLRGVDAIDSYPCLITWLTEFMGAFISKKYPQPGKTQPQTQAAEKKGRIRKMRRNKTAEHG